MLNNRECIQWHFDQEFARKHEVDISPAGLSINHLDKQFLEKCIAMVEKHIENPDYSVAETTYKIGFQDLKYFRECFNTPDSAATLFSYSTHPAGLAKARVCRF